ncbi:MAG: amino acid ABC transporter permease [Alphaproteobacteria bacterium]|nr:amino acid ABC transporter permease [Alphaproteobacteria bacterium]MBV9153339.1 amino acid ABC transporter permease [Alphaproteobacteria bacterium]MBV9584405.1 amino acid ABC transporter permease [Alphaproteobacteria bacterium]MBV9967153.1 amino acid ABC transporter permease [Alphaproteobacteria bacterium]
MAIQTLATPSRPAPWRDPRVRAIVVQVVFVAVLAAFFAFLAYNTIVNLRRQSIATGFGFLDREAAFGIGESLIAYSPADTYARAFLVGLVNTLYVSAIGIVLATILGTLMGLARLSSNWLVAKLAQIYVETFRNIPLALQLLFWWALLRGAAPPPRQAWELLPGIFISNRGITFPVPFAESAYPWMAVAFIVGLVIAFVVRRWARARQERTGRQFPTGWVALALILGLPALVFLASGAPLRLDIPVLRGFNFAGGTAVSPELGALLIGLVVYTGTFIAEIVRAGILAVSWGQSEAAMALGLRPGQRMRLVVLPQALRVIVPPMTSEYLSLTKNSSLAVIIGYPDLVSIANTTMNQTGQAVEGIAMIMMVYLAISLLISLFMNLYNRTVALVER